MTSPPSPEHDRGTARRVPPVLVTGAMGQVGTLVSTLLLERGQPVIALDLPSPAAADTARSLMDLASHAKGELIPVFVDITDPATVGRVVADHRPAGIVHLASVIPPAAYRNPRAAHRVNVAGTRNLVTAALGVDPAPVVVLASSAAVYGSRNPHRHHGRVTAAVPVNPVDCYGATKVAAEEAVNGSGLPHVVLRLGGIMSPDAMAGVDAGHLAFTQAIPRDNRVHMVDARDVALAFVNALERIDLVDGHVLNIGGNDTYLRTHSELQDDVFQVLGLGRLGPGVNLPGDPSDDRGWGLTDWFDTTESQRLLQFQAHDWSDTLAWLAASIGRRRVALRLAGPVLRPLIRGGLAMQRRWDRRGPYADPWALISAKFGDDALGHSSPPRTPDAVG